MPQINNQTHLREVRKLSFCYVCGRNLLPEDETNYDHVPPQTCFDKNDRNPPLKLKTHLSCNGGNSLNDEKVGELIAFQRNKKFNGKQLNVQVLHDAQSGQYFAAFDNLDVECAVRRWVSGFHAALYGQPLRKEVPFNVSTPLPSGKISSTGIKANPIRKQDFVFVETLKLNRAANNLDIVSTNAGKLRYDCVWAPLDNGDFWLCIFALDIYEWITMGDIQHFESRGCVGAYFVKPQDVPLNATRATNLQAPIANNEPLNPFGL
jgi:hypothetical protein